jgi:hypothetical protein
MMEDEEDFQRAVTSAGNTRGIRGGIPAHIRARLMLDKSKLVS